MPPLHAKNEFGMPPPPPGESGYRCDGNRNSRLHATSVTVLTVIIALVLSGCVTTPPTKRVSYSKTPVYFVTDRKAAKSKTLHTPFTAERGPLRYGQCYLSMPNSHKPGSIERPAMTDLQFSEDPNIHISLLSLGLNPRRHFYTTLNRHLRGMKNPRVLVFIHGYNTGFSDAAYRSAQLKNDLQFDGPMIFYSWPSQSATISYSIDVSNIRWSRPNMKRFLREIATHTENAKIYLLAHSLGTRGLTNALLDLTNESPHLRTRFTEVILAAPDIDKDIFKRDIAPRLVTRHPSVTLYASSNDYALQLSKSFNGYPRVGDSGFGIGIFRGIETIDSSNIATSFLGHSYHAESSIILRDIAELIFNGKRARQRKTLRIMKTKKGHYWRFPKPATTIKK